jgi:protocatechuate 3,4-dioxygenase beta subunit
MKKDNSNRRQFLRNVSLASLSIGALPHLAISARPTPPPPGDDCFATTLDFYGQGPFYTPNPPAISDGKLAVDDEPGTRMLISGRVVTLDCEAFIPDTLIDIWHANDAGAYDNVGFNLRGTVQSNSQGFFFFETILPGKYLNGAQFRPRHIHFKITPPGHPTLITQLYFEGDESIPADAAASITSGTYDASHRIIALTSNMDGTMEGTWDVVVDGDGISAASDIHLNKGMIYTVGPNPFDSQVNIRYGVFKRARVSLKVYDTHGRLVSILDEKELVPEKYEAVWNPEAGLPNGHYFIVLQTNDVQVHYLKVVLNR